MWFDSNDKVNQVDLNNMIANGKNDRKSKIFIVHKFHLIFKN